MYKNNAKNTYTSNGGIVAKLPFGFRDIFPTEADERTKIEDIIREEFELWGYGEVKTPVVEYTKNISEGVGKNWESKLVNFFDVDGKLVSLRADMTIPIARLTGMRIKKSQLPVRFYYFANCFRQSELQKGLKRVYNQAGLEFIGSYSFMSDVEVILILINLLKKLEVSDYKVGLGHVDVVEGLFNWVGLEAFEKEYLRKKLILKNFVAVEEFLKEKDEKKAKICLELIKPQSSLEHAESLVSKIEEERTQKGTSYLKKVYETLKELELDKFIIIDFGILRDFEYYTGLLFEVYSLGVTNVLGSGGRYDGLIKKFGLDAPATGFALDLDLIHKSIDSYKLAGLKGKRKILIYNESKNYHEVIKVSGEIRSKGICVELLFNNKNVEFESLVNLAKERKYKWLGIVKSDLKNIVLVNVAEKKKETLELSLFLKKVKGLLR